MRNNRRQPQRVPPPLLSGGERIDGEGILDDFSGDAGLVLWKTFRAVALWVQLSVQERRELVSSEAWEARMAHIQVAEGLEGVEPALIGLAEMYERPITRTMVVARCRAVERWAEERQAGRTALEFGQLAALAAPEDAEVAVAVARRGRDLAEYARAESWYWQAIVRARRKGEWMAYVYSMLGLGVTHRLRGNYPAARRSIERGRRRARRQGFREQEGMALHELMVLAIHADNLKRTHQYAREALEAYGQEHTRVPWLAHDLGVFWMNRGYFRPALEVFLATPDATGAPTERMLRSASIARAAGAVGESDLYAIASTATRRMLVNPGTTSRSSTALMELARGALSLGRIDEAAVDAEEARRLAIEHAEGELKLEAEAILGEIRSANHARNVVPVRPPKDVEEFTCELLERLGAATAV